MLGARRVVWMLLTALAGSWGCAGMPLAHVAGSTASSAISSDAAGKPASGKLASPSEAATKATASENKTPPAAIHDSQAMVDVLNQLQSLRDMDPAAYEQIKSDLQNTDPKLWPPMVQSFRAALAYRQRAAAPPPAPHALPPSKPIGHSLMPALAAAPAAATLAAPALNVQTTPQLGYAPMPASVAPPISTTTHHSPLTHSPLTHSPLTHSPLTTAASDLAWQQQLATAIRGLEQELSQSPNLSTGDRRQVYLRMMHLIAGSRDAALRPIPGLDAAEQEFWSQELFGLSKYLDIPAQPDRSRRAAEAARYLGEALPKLSQLASLAVKNIAFCSEVSSYGVLTRFDKNEFVPGQQVLLYAEVENLVSEATPKGHHTALSSSCQVFDARGQRVQEQEFPLTEEYCLNARRDFFIRYFLRMPEQIYDGPHTLQLTIEDTLGHKVAQSKIDFQIKRGK